MSHGAGSPKCESTKDLRNGGSDGAAIGAAVETETAAIDPGLEAVIRAWPDLPEALRAGIVTMVKVAGG